MQKPLIAALALSLLFAACGGGGSDDDGGGGGGTNAGSTSAMAGSFSSELVKLRDCVQGEVDGKSPCSADFLSNPVTLMCSDVRTGKPNQFPGADYTKFTGTCDQWSTVLTTPGAEKVAKLNTMIGEVDALK